MAERLEANYKTHVFLTDTPLKESVGSPGIIALLEKLCNVINLGHCKLQFPGSTYNVFTVYEEIKWCFP